MDGASNARGRGLAATGLGLATDSTPLFGLLILLSVLVTAPVMRPVLLLLEVVGMEGVLGDILNCDASLRSLQKEKLIIVKIRSAKEW